MAPRRPDSTAVAQAETDVLSEANVTTNIERKTRPPQQIVWLNVYLISALHLMALYGLYLLPGANPWTWLWIVQCFCWGGMGVTVGAHRLWTHRSYKATWPLRLYLMIVNCMAAQNDILEWTRDHRVHHKYSETDADPHNAKRGFFFSHVGWLMVKKHPDVIKKGKQLDLSDLYQDKIVMFQRRHYKLLSTIFNIIIPTVVPWYVWNETFRNAFFISFAFRYAFFLNMAWCVNSLAHIWGSRPYDETIGPSENAFVVMGTVGEGYHNFHHAFPHDYATAELGSPLNVSKWVIDVCAMFGLAYDLKTVSKEAILQRRMRTGNLQHLKYHDD